MKIAFFAPYPRNTVASQRFRFEQYFSALEKKGITCRHYPFYSRRAFNVLYRKGYFFKKFAGVMTGFIRRLVQILRSLESDITFVHREMAPLGPPILEWMLIIFFRKKIIYDFDDALWISDKPSKKGWLRKIRWNKKIAWICRKSYRISAGNAYLADFAARYNPSVIINPTTIDMSGIGNIRSAQNTDVVTIGWTGSHTTLKYLDAIREPLREILSQYKMTRLVIICNRRPEWELNNMTYVKWKETTEWEDLSRIQIGLMPLPDDPWTRGKCGFKILEYFAVGIPALASPVGINAQLIDNGKNGFLCEDENDWVKNLDQLIREPLLRSSMGETGRKLVEDKFSLNANLETFLSLFE